MATKIIVTSTNGDILTVTAPEGKSMVVDPGLMAHGILSIGEYGPSGIKVAAFKNWSTAVYADAQDAGYTFEEGNPF